MVVSGNPLAWSREKALLQEPKWAVQSMAPLPPASAASKCSRPRISTSFPRDRARPRSRITSMTSQECHPEELPGQALSLFRAEFVTEHPAQVTDDLGALPGPVPETPIPPPAGDTVGEAGGQPRRQRRHYQPVDDSLCSTRQSL